MPQALVLTNAFKQNITGGAFEALAAATGDSLTVPNVPQGQPGRLLRAYGVATANPNEISITGSRFHDQVRGIRANLIDGDLTAPINSPQLLIPDGFDQPLYPSDTLSVQTNGTANDDVNVLLLAFYPNLPGVAARLASADFVEAAMINLVGIRVAPTAGAGDWGATVALNSTESRLHADRDYALLGWTTSVAVSGIAISGIDTGNQKVGGPGLGRSEHDAYYFAALSRITGLPLIPVINSNNQGGVLIQAAQAAGAGAVNIDLLFAELGQKFSG